MRKIQLHRPAVDNFGRFVDAGAIVEVGEMEDRITADRADALIGEAGAIEVKPDRAEAKASKDG